MANDIGSGNTLKVLVVEPEKRPYEKEIPVGLKYLQQEVDGNIQAIYPFAEPVAIVCDEEGKLKGKPKNRVLRDDDGNIYDTLDGTFLVVGLGDEDFISLTPELKEKFYNHFYTPEMFVNLGNSLLAVPIKQPTLEPYPSVYHHTRQYAAEHGEMNQFLVSARENIACKEAIEQAIRDHFSDNKLDATGARDVLKQFGRERVQFILASTIQHKREDTRISPSNKAWASIMYMPEDGELYRDTAQFVVNQAHPGLVNLFTSQTKTLISFRDVAKQNNQAHER